MILIQVAKGPLHVHLQDLDALAQGIHHHATLLILHILIVIILLVRLGKAGFEVQGHQQGRMQVCT